MAAPHGAGFVAGLDAAANPGGCSLFEPVPVFGHAGVFKDEATGLCVGWTQHLLTPPLTIVPDITGMALGECGRWELGHHRALQLFVDTGSNGFCLLSLNGLGRMRAVGAGASP